TRIMVFVKTLLRRSDNFMYIVKKSELAKKALLVDLVNEESYGELAEKEGIEISAVLTTHHHYDHCGGNEQFRRDFPKIPIFGGDPRVPGMDNHVKHEQEAELADLKVVCLSTPCHTSGHICYYITDPSNTNHGVVFTGDTLFIAGCGRFFEGTAPEMDRALNTILAKLPDDTLIYPGHEYTVANLKFAAHVEPANLKVQEKLKWAESQVARGLFTAPSSVLDEKLTNPFMRVRSSEEIQKTLGGNDPIEGMAKLRELKNKF
uniref:hydroxyacylglutathione hydrolase n=2 Tax=Caenorhabditis japonica TaxID=281687 RepID=A0A8R1E907_CAEJA